jgi:hypothetical protein
MARKRAEGGYFSVFKKDKPGGTDLVVPHPGRRVAEDIGRAQQNEADRHADAQPDQPAAPRRGL